MCVHDQRRTRHLKFRLFGKDGSTRITFDKHNDKSNISYILFIKTIHVADDMNHYNTVKDNFRWDTEFDTTDPQMRISVSK